MDKLLKTLKNNYGTGYPLVVAITLVLVMIFAGISEYFRLMIIAEGVMDAMQEAVISTVTENYDDVYHGVREGYSGAYQPEDKGFAQFVDYGDIYDKMDQVLGLDKRNDYHVKEIGKGKTEFQIWDLNINIKNAPLAKEDDALQRFKIESSIMLEVPVSFGSSLLPSMKIKLRNSAGYTPRF